ncbi:LysE family translocator [Acinetobacter sp.]|uniref:LysE family translocator n=1 Tax=Acinetobacter sp. TaxID=472 RepID=UPI0031D9EE96
MASLFIPYLLAITLLTITPGLDTTLILRTSALEGRNKAIQAALGVNLGCLIWGVLIACGLGTLLSQSLMAFTVLKWAGALYLTWLGIQMIIRPRKQLSTGDNTETSQQNWFLKGCLGNLLNPKVGIFYISFLPQFIPNSQAATSWILFLVMIHVVIGLIWSMLLIRSTQSLAKYFKRPRVIQNIDRLSGGIFLLFALKLALTKR